MFLQLRFVLPGEKIQSLLSESLEEQAMAPDSESRSSSKLPPFMPFSAGESEPVIEWPEDFNIIVFHCGEYGTYPEEGYWDKGFSYGVAISAERNQVVYWSDRVPILSNLAEFCVNYFFLGFSPAALRGRPMGLGDHAGSPLQSRGFARQAYGYGRPHRVALTFSSSVCQLAGLSAM
jgi:hypothetical protein